MRVSRSLFGLHELSNTYLAAPRHRLILVNNTALVQGHVTHSVALILSVHIEIPNLQEMGGLLSALDERASHLPCLTCWGTQWRCAMCSVSKLTQVQRVGYRPDARAVDGWKEHVRAGSVMDWSLTLNPAYPGQKLYPATARLLGGRRRSGALNGSHERCVPRRKRFERDTTQPTCPAASRVGCLGIVRGMVIQRDDTEASHTDLVALLTGALFLA